MVTLWSFQLRLLTKSSWSSLPGQAPCLLVTVSDHSRVWQWDTLVRMLCLWNSLLDCLRLWTLPLTSAPVQNVCIVSIPLQLACSMCSQWCVYKSTSHFPNYWCKPINCQGFCNVLLLFYHYIFQITIWAQKQHFAYAHNIRYVILWCITKFRRRRLENYSVPYIHFDLCCETGVYG